MFFWQHKRRQGTQEDVTPSWRMRSTTRVSVTDRVVTEAEGAGPTVEKWRVCSKRTAVERKQRTQSRRDRAGARSDGVRTTPVPGNWPVYTHRVSRSLAPSYRLFFGSSVCEWRDTTTRLL